MGPHIFSMNSSESTVQRPHPGALPDAVQSRDVAESHKGLRIPAKGITVNVTHQPKTSDPGSQGDHRTDAWVSDGVIEIGQAIFIATSQEASPISCMTAVHDPKPPRLHDSSGSGNPPALRPTRRRQQRDRVAGRQG
jgi:hypothetical protein